MPEAEWEMIHDKEHERIKRFRIPGGWLYLVELHDTYERRAESGSYNTSESYRSGWHPPVFVPESSKGSRPI